MKKLSLISWCTALALLFGGDFAFCKELNIDKNKVSTQSKETKKTDNDRWIEAAKNGDLSTITSFLQSKKVDVNYATRTGSTALSNVISSKSIKDEKKRVKIVTFLLDQGADLNSGKYSSPLMDASQYSREEIVEILINRGAKVTGDSLMRASSSGNINIVKSLINNGADVNYKNRFGAFPLSNAAWSGHLDVVKYLVEHGAKINEQAKYLGSPLYGAANCGHVDIVKYLVEKDADVNLLNPAGRTALMAAIVHKISKKNTIQAKQQIISVLLKAKTDLTTIDKEGQTPLSLAQAQRRLAKQTKNSATENIWLNIIQNLKDAGAKE